MGRRRGRRAEESPAARPPSSTAAVGATLATLLAAAAGCLVLLRRRRGRRRARARPGTRSGPAGRIRFAVDAAVDALERFFLPDAREEIGDGGRTAWVAASGSESDMTVRAGNPGPGAGGGGAAGAPLRGLFFRPAGLRGSNSEGRLPPGNPDGFDRRADGEHPGPPAETDADRFRRAYEGRIRHAEYARLVLPPSCVRVETAARAPSGPWNLEGAGQQFVQTGLSYVPRRWSDCVAYVRNVIGATEFLHELMFRHYLSRESLRRLSLWIVRGFRRRFRGGTGRDDAPEGEEDSREGTETDEDDCSAATAGDRRPSVGSASEGRCASPAHLGAETPRSANRKLPGRAGEAAAASAAPAALVSPSADSAAAVTEELGGPRSADGPGTRPQDHTRRDCSLLGKSRSDVSDGSGESAVGLRLSRDEIERSRTQDSSDGAARAPGVGEEPPRPLEMNIEASRLPRPRFGTSGSIRTVGTADGDDQTYHSTLSASDDGAPRNPSGDAVPPVDVPRSIGGRARGVPVSPLPARRAQGGNAGTPSRRRDALDFYRRGGGGCDLRPIALPSLRSSRTGSDSGPPAAAAAAAAEEEEKNGKEMADPPPSHQDDGDRAPSASPVPGMNFFDAADSRRSLRNLSREVPLPDANGYILGDVFLPSPSCCPLLVFVNGRSGPRTGGVLKAQLRGLLNPIQVWDLAEGGPERVLTSFSSAFRRFQVLVCGGDGTVSWVISSLERLDLDRWPPIAILPLGTGNDLARVHGWGGGYANESLLGILDEVCESYVSMLDLWELDVEPTRRRGGRKGRVGGGGGDGARTTRSFLNYLGVGVDAHAALQVHNLRETKPTLFFSRFFNKAWYAIAGGEEVIKSSCAGLPGNVSLVADGVEIELPPDTQGIIFLNIDSYTGGVPLWGTGRRRERTERRRRRRYSEGDFQQAQRGDGGGSPRRHLASEFGIFAGDDHGPRQHADDLAGLDRHSNHPVLSSSSSHTVVGSDPTACDLPNSCQDGLIEVVSVRGSFHLGQIRVGLGRSVRLCQCREARVVLRRRVAVQVDGEPWRQEPAVLRVRRKGRRATMLNRADDGGGGVEAEVTRLLNWASETDVIDREQYSQLVEEFGRRVERKRLKRREEAGFSLAG